MATVEFHEFNYSGTGLAPGASHDWWMTHSAYRRAADVRVQVNVTAHPSVYLPHYHELIPSELSVENVRSRVTDSGRVMYFTVRNTGPNPVLYYRVGVSFIDG